MGATNLDLSGMIDPSLLQAQIQNAGGSSVVLDAGPNATTGTTLLDTEVINAGDEDEIIDTSNITSGQDNTINTSLLSQTSDQSGDTTSDDNISTATDSASIDVESVTPDFVTDQWRSDNWRFSNNNSSWQENTDGTFTQTMPINLGAYGILGDMGGVSEPIDIQYKWDADGNFIGLADGTEEAKVTDTQSDTEDLDLDNISTINTDPIELNNGNFAYAFDANQDGEIDSYRITDSAGIEIETISADQYTGTGYVPGFETQTRTVGADDASTDGSYLGIIDPLADDDVWKTGSEDADGDGIPDGILKTGISADQIEAHTFADGSEGFIFTVDIPGTEGRRHPKSGAFIELPTEGMSYSMYWNENGQLVDSEGKGAEGMDLKTTVKTDGDSDNETELDSETLDAMRTTLNEILVDTGSDVTDEFVSLYNEISGLFATGDDGVLTADDEQQLLAFFNTMIDQGTDTGVILSSKTMTDYFNLVKEYTGQYNGTISDADMDTFLADWLAESKLFVSGLDNSQKWSLDNITDHSQYENLQNLIELVYGEGRTLTAEEAMRYLTDYSWKSEGKGWLYGVGGNSILDSELSVTNFLVGQMVLNAEGTDQEYVTSFWLTNDDLDLEAYGLTLNSIAQAWGTTEEELKVNTAKAKKNKKKKKSTGSFFAPKDVVRIGDEDPGSSPQTITGKGGRSRTKPNTLLGGSIMTSTLTGSN